MGGALGRGWADVRVGMCVQGRKDERNPEPCTWLPTSSAPGDTGFPCSLLSSLPHPTPALHMLPPFFLTPPVPCTCSLLSSLPHPCLPFTAAPRAHRGAGHAAAAAAAVCLSSCGSCSCSCRAPCVHGCPMLEEARGLGCFYCTTNSAGAAAHCRGDNVTCAIRVVSLHDTTSIPPGGLPVVCWPRHMCYFPVLSCLPSCAISRPVPVFHLFSLLCACLLSAPCCRCCPGAPACLALPPPGDLVACSKTLGLSSERTSGGMRLHSALGCWAQRFSCPQATTAVYGGHGAQHCWVRPPLLGHSTGRSAPPGSPHCLQGQAPRRGHSTTWVLVWATPGHSTPQQLSAQPAKVTAPPPLACHPACT